MLTSKYNHWQNQKIYPKYFYQLKSCPHANPIFITIDWRCLKFIKDHHGICLYCTDVLLLSAYDFSFCYNRDVWILCSTQKNFTLSMQLGQIIQLSAASKVLVIPFDNKLL